MAKESQYSQYLHLRDLIRTAIEDAEQESQLDEPSYTIAISPDLSEVYATYLPRWDDETLSACMDTNWHIEHAEGADDADEIAILYFDLRLP